jgi:hypothetical protein
LRQRFLSAAYLPLIPFLLAAGLARAQEFREVPLGFPAVGVGQDPRWDARMVPGDFDHDGDPDMLIFGKGLSGASNTLEIWRNDGKGGFSRFEDFHALGDSLTTSGDWTDVDHDGYYEFVTWLQFPNNPVTDHLGGFMRMYTYDPGSARFVIKAGFAPPTTPILAYEYPLLRFSDLDHDGYPEMLVSAHIVNPPGTKFRDNTSITTVFRNRGNLVFEAIPGLEGVKDPVAAFGDFDQDGKTDLFLAGNDTSNQPNARIYRNTGDGFTVYANLAPDYAKVFSADWGDYNGDHRPDLVLVGGYERATRLFQNTGTGFQYDKTHLYDTVDVAEGAASFGDIDGDGDLDLLVCGMSASSHDVYTQIMINDEGWFVDLPAKLPPFWQGVGVLADYDGDGNPDILVSGYTRQSGGKTFRTGVFRNIRGDLLADPALDAFPQGRPRWGDFDGDGDLDLIICAQDQATAPNACRYFRNDNGSLSRQASALDAAWGEAETGDLDGDGRLDVILAGTNNNMTGTNNYSGNLRYFRNTGSGFQEKALDLDTSLLPLIMHARVADFDRDGKTDLAVWGMRGFDYTPYNDRCWSAILRNQGQGAFAEAPKGALPGLCNGEMAWGDFDRDGDPDLLFAGDTSYGGNGTPITGVYRNDDGGFVRTADRPQSLGHGQVAWGDFDADGYLDFAESGDNVYSGSQDDQIDAPTSIVYRQVGGRFEETFRPPYQTYGAVAWLDIDNDGDLDLIPSGQYQLRGKLTLIYRNDGTEFTTLVPKGYNTRGNLAVGDFDGDGDADVAIGNQVYKNTLMTGNALPIAPGGLSATLGTASVRLSWGASSDAETAPAGMQYNFRMGTSPGASDVVSPASAASGFRLAPATGNAGAIREATVTHLAPGEYFWSVQGIDKQLAGSPFPAEGRFTLGLPAPELLSAEAGPAAGMVALRWKKMPQSHFRRYWVHYGTAADPVARMDSLARAGDTSLVIPGLANGTPYHFRLSAEDAGGNVSPFSGELIAIPDGTPPAIPAPMSAVAGDRTITLSWPAAGEPDFRNYLIYQRNNLGPWERIDSIADPAIASKVVTDLKNGTPYGFMVAAVDRLGNQSAFSPEITAIPAYLLTPRSPALAFGKIGLAASRDSGIVLSNASALRVQIDSIRIVNPAFSLQGMPASLPAQADTSLTIRFNSTKAAGGDFSGTLKLYYGGAARPLEIDLSGTAAAPPWCRIDRVTPSDLAWDTAASVSFLASANDSDNAGEGDRIAAYLWSSSNAGSFGENASGFAFSPAALGIGVHDIALRVVDNEGDTSAPSHAVLTVRSRKPLVRIDSIAPRGLIIRGADRPRFRCTAYDRDEGADASHDSLKAFDLFSTVQGRLSGAKDTAFGPTAFDLGLHGFYARAIDDEGDTSWSDTLWVPVQAGVGLALIAAGMDFNDKLYYFQNIAPTCNWAYSRLRQRGFTDSLITYLNPVGWQSIGENYLEDSHIVDATGMTVAALRARILGFRDRVRNGVPLLITLIGHGGHANEQNGKFFLAEGESVTPDSLDSWLDTYDTAPGDSLRTPIVMVLDFCYAGSFIPKLRSASQNRIVITSAGADRQAYFQNGQSFSYAFFKQIAKGGNLAQAFSAGVAWSENNALSGQARANPQANADLDDVPNETGDLQRLADIFIGGSQQNQSPEAEWKKAEARIDDDAETLTLRAVPEGPIPVDTAWFAVIAPDFKAAPQGEPFAFMPLTRGADSAFTGKAKLDGVLSGDYMVLVYGSAGGSDMLPIATRAYSRRTVSLLDGAAERFGLGQNFPNPAQGQTWIPFALTKRGPMTMTLWDMRGAEIRVLAAGTYPPGRYLLRWDGRDGLGRQVPAGVYTFRLKSPEGTLRKKLVWR